MNSKIRYLSSFHPKQVSHRFVDVLVIGGGLAGLRAATAVNPQQSVLVVTKDELLTSNSQAAQGGIAGVLDPQDCFEEHVADTLRAGGNLCDEEVVDLVVREAPECIEELIELGTRFDEQNGHLMLGREGGHSRRRIVHALGDATGKEVMRAISDRAKHLANVRIWENTFTVDLLTQEDRCRGAIVWHEDYGKILVWAKQTIICTGGAGQLYRESTNPKVATADGHAIAYRAGAELRDMEFMQFHPTVLYIAGSSRHLITEAIRGEGAHLVDRHGRQFMVDYDSRGELAPRDVVSHAIVKQMEKTQHSCVYLDLSHLDPQKMRTRFPGITATCAQFGIDIATDRIPVRPGAHYMIGGLTVDLNGRTTLPGLWAAGEVTSSGLHGANRLASNSLLEGLVFGKRVGAVASQEAAEMEDSYHAPPLAQAAMPLPDEQLDLVDIRNSLKSLMWRSAGVQREQESLLDASAVVENWCRYVFDFQFSEPAGWELQNLLQIAQIVVKAALIREESRGVHLRTDFPKADDNKWLHRISFSVDSWPT